MDIENPPKENTHEDCSIEIDLEESEIQLLRKLAKTRGITLNELVETLLKKYQKDINTEEIDIEK